MTETCDQKAILIFLLLQKAVACIATWSPLPALLRFSHLKGRLLANWADDNWWQLLQMVGSDPASLQLQAFSPSITD